VAVAASRWLTDAVPGTSEMVKAIRVSTAIAAAILALALAAQLLRIKEFNDATSRIVRRIAPGRR
jgi:hypothetical protein